ncbi:glycine cleavage system aminomethyltransferase GcvT [Sphingomonas sp. Leaf37]|uniref:glycine cleavage system aminomethyltransferase GcvT n=1 Tax=Sphingomonas sp. Leaf37 TaxID=2876552 RepID=UPI001E2BFE2D|nr:glycine cleavage system aminomethyltransferase GcvT [Sphingomonas sp. Leaf37]
MSETLPDTLPDPLDGLDEGDEPAILQLPLDAWHRARGGRMVPFAGYEMPVQYDGIMAEHLWTRESAGLFDVSHMGQVGLTGDGLDAAGVARALEAVLPGDISGLAATKIRYSLLLNDEGGILDDLMATRLPEEGAHPFGEASYYVVVNGATKYDDLSYLLDVLPDDITMNLMEDQALLAVQGPKAVAAVARLIPGVADLVFMTAGAFEWNGHALWISRSGYTGEDGVEISIPAEAAAGFADAICAEPEVKPIGLGARDSLRLEAGLPLYGHDLDPETTPVMADLGFALSKRRREAADFAGAARILAEREDGPAVKRVGLSVAGRQPVREGASVVDADGAVMGRVTSGGFAPSVGAPIAMAYVPTALATAGTSVRLVQRGKIHEATVTPMPFVPHRYVRAGGK